jgi:hypothetical protein
MFCTACSCFGGLLRTWLFRVLCLASWWPAGKLVHYMTSHFMENRSLFFVVHVKFEFVACVCNLERPSRPLLPRQVSPYRSAVSLPSHKALSAMIRPRPNHRNLCRIMKELRVALHLTKIPLRSSSLWVFSSKHYGSMEQFTIEWLSP